MKARGDFVTLFALDLPSGRSSAPTRHLYGQLVYVPSGQGSTKIEVDGREIAFEWGPHSLFALPLNMNYRLFTGSGYSLMWYEDDKDRVRIDWRHGVVFSPPETMYHQHFNASPEPARYLAMNLGNQRYPFTAERMKQLRTLGVGLKDGGRQIEYEDQDPAIHKLYLEELAAHGAQRRMGEFIDAEQLGRDKAKAV